MAEAEVTSVVSNTVFSHTFAHEIAQPQLSRNKYFDNFDTFNTPSTTNPVDEWLNTPPVTTATDGLKYWAAILASGHPLARMALDFLSTPGQCIASFFHHLLNILLATSTDVEWAFSRGGLTVSKMRHSLSGESTRAASVFGSWCDLPGAVPHDEIMAAFKDKGKWPKNNNAMAAVSSEDVNMTSG
jgi:hypothetical protein